MRLRHRDGAGEGKSALGIELATIRFLEIVPNERIVEAVRFQTTAREFAGEMIFAVTITPLQDGAKVPFTGSQVPPGISCRSSRRDGIDASQPNSLYRMTLKRQAASLMRSAAFFWAVAVRSSSR